MRLNNFSGGLSTRRSPRAIDDAQSTICRNVDFTSLDVLPFKKPSPFQSFQDDSGDVFYDFKDSIYSASALLQNPIDPVLPVFIEYVDDLYLIDKQNIDGTGTLQRLINQGTDEEELTRAGFRHDDVDITTYYTYGKPEPTSETVSGPKNEFIFFNTRNENTVAEVIDILENPEDPDYRAAGPAFVREIAQIVSNIVAHERGADVAYELRFSTLNGSLNINYVSDFLDPSASVVNNNPQPITQGLQPHTITRTQTNQAIYVFEITRDGEVLPNITGSPSTNITVQVPNFEGDLLELQSAGDIIESSQEIVPRIAYQYIITLVSSTTGFESSFIDRIINLEAYETDFVSFGFFENVSLLEDTYLDTVRIYRLGNGATVGTLVNEFLISDLYSPGPGSAPFTTQFGTFHYVNTDADLTSAPYLNPDARLFDSLSTGEVPDNIVHGIEAGNRIVLTSGRNLHASELGDQDSFPVVNTIEFNQEIVGVAESSRGLLVFFPYKTYVINIANSGRYTKTLLSADQGCTTYRSISHLGTTPYWTSNEGVCTLVNGAVSVISKTDLDFFTLKPLASFIYDEKYYALRFSGEALVYDLRFSRRVAYDIDFDENVTNFARINGTFYGIISKGLYRLFEGDDLVYDYKTGLLESNQITELKTYDVVYVYKLDDKEVVITITNQNGTVMAKKTTSKKGLIDLKIKSACKQEYGMSVQLQGTGRVAEVNWSIEGRQNGR